MPRLPLRSRLRSRHEKAFGARLQHEVYRDADPEKKEVGHKSIADWEKAGINHTQYKAYASRAAE